MSTPLELRNRRREAQRTIRLALNVVMSSLDAWKAAIDEGKKHATNLTNDILTSNHIPQLPVAALASIPGLKQACLTKLVSQIGRHLDALQNCLQTLESALVPLNGAVGQVAAIVQIEETQPMLRRGPVFTSLPLHTIAAMLQRVESMHASELEIKKVVVDDFRVACAEAQQRAAGGSNDSLSQSRAQISSGSGSTGTANGIVGGSWSLDRVESFLQVHITAWMLSPEIDEAGVEADLALITQDANSC